MASSKSSPVITIALVALLLGHATSCQSGCSYCSNNYSCSICNSGYYLRSGSCYYCPTGCQTCSYSTSKSTVCTRCKAGYRLSNSRCTSTSGTVGGSVGGSFGGLAICGGVIFVYYCCQKKKQAVHPVHPSANTTVILGAPNPNPNNNSTLYQQAPVKPYDNLQDTRPPPITQVHINTSQPFPYQPGPVAPSAHHRTQPQIQTGGAGQTHYYGPTPAGPVVLFSENKNQLPLPPGFT